MDQINLQSLLHEAGLPKTGMKTGLRAGDDALKKLLLPSEPGPESLLHRELLDSAGITVSPQLIEEARNKMRSLLRGNREKSPAPTAAPASGSPAQLAMLLPFFIALKGEIEKELENNISRLMALNPSRREAVALHLDRLAGHGTAPSTLAGSLDAAGGLRRWVEGPRSPAQNLALQIYFEEIALITLGHALLLKIWSDRGFRPWSRADLKDLNWALNTAAKKPIPHDRENWHVARQNIYSWYKPSDVIQSEIWETTNSWRIKEEGPGFIPWLFTPSRTYRSEHMAPQGYDSRFYQAIWRHLPLFGINPNQPPGPIKRNWLAFSPTLRDGAMARVTPPTVSWIGLETSAFQLMTAELMELWNKPCVPPLWCLGTGLEAHASDQLSLGTGYSNPKPSLISRIAEMEACDVAFILEERSVRLSGKNPEANRLRETLEGLPYFKKLRSSGTTLGDLQACVALSKLRPGGLLWWAREEPLVETDGKEMLNFLLERAKLCCEWDFSELDHSLPATKPAFPKYLYLFARETGVEARLTHRPTRISLQGQIRSHVEIPLILQDAFSAFQGQPGTAETRSQWKLHSQKSPTPQREWSERWPDPTSQTILRNLEKIRENSLPLASATTVRTLSEHSAAAVAKDHSKATHHWLEDLKGLKGFWVHSEQNSEGRRLRALPLPQAAPSGGFVILVADENWLAPLSLYLESSAVRMWLDHHAERKGEKWILSEQLVKCIPVPRCLLEQLGFDVSPSSSASQSKSQDNAIPPDQERTILEILENTRVARPKFDTLGSAAQAALFTRAAWEIGKLQMGNTSFLSLITPSGNVHWAELLKMLPPSECVAVTLHPKIRIMGNLPLHMAIGRFERIKAPSPGILFATEAGFHVCVASDSPMVLDMLWDQLQGLTSPTWSELVAFLRLPRRTELAEATANDVLRIHGEQSRRMGELSELISACSLF